MIIIWRLKCGNDIQDNSTYSTWFGSWTYIINIIKVINRYIKKHFCPIFDDFSKFHSTKMTKNLSLLSSTPIHHCVIFNNPKLTVQGFWVRIPSPSLQLSIIHLKASKKFATMRRVCVIMSILRRRWRFL